MIEGLVGFGPLGDIIAGGLIILLIIATVWALHVTKNDIQDYLNRGRR